MNVRSSVVTTSEEETAAVAARLAASLEPGSVVLLFGDLGAGKTAFVRGMAAGLGLDPDEVSSPTFTLIQEYRRPAPVHGTAAGETEALQAGRAETSPADEDEASPDAAPRARLYHVDLYRLEAAEVDDLGLEELTAGGGIVAIEWAEKLTRPIEGAVQVHVSEEGEEGRRIQIRID